MPLGKPGKSLRRGRGQRIVSTKSFSDSSGSQVNLPQTNVGTGSTQAVEPIPTTQAPAYTYRGSNSCWSGGRYASDCRRRHETLYVIKVTPDCFNFVSLQLMINQLKYTLFSCRIISSSLKLISPESWSEVNEGIQSRSRPLIRCPTASLCWMKGGGLRRPSQMVWNRKILMFRPTPRGRALKFAR